MCIGLMLYRSLAQEELVLTRNYLFMSLLPVDACGHDT
jgi:hypothetical protein